MENCFKSLVFVFACVYLAKSTDNFDCLEALRRERILRKVSIRDGVLHNFYAVSYSILIDSGSTPHDFILPTIVSGKPVENLYSFGFRRGSIAFSYNHNASHSTGYNLKPFEGFKSQIDGEHCVGSLESPKVMKTTGEKFRSKLRHSIVLLFGCEVYLVQKQPKVEKMAILIDNESYDPDLIKNYLKRFGGQNLKMTNINYKFFSKRGFCICDDIIDYLNCDDGTSNEYSIFVAICALVVGLMAISVLAWFCHGYLKTVEEVGDSEITANQRVPDPKPIVTVTKTEIDNHEVENYF
jgi:hypothetical protein